MKFELFSFVLGYMNESGELNLTRFEIYLTELAKFDHQRFADENDTFKHLNKFNGRNRNSSKKNDENDDGFDLGVLDKLTMTTPEIEKQDPIVEKLDHVISNERKVSNVFSSSSSSNDGLSSDSDTDSEKSNDDEQKKTSSSIPKVINEDDFDNLPLIEAEFRQHKNHYYRDKMKIDLISTDQLKIYVEQYIEAIQWILKYYYQGCSSWSWFYPYHYAPYLSDLKNFKQLKITFQTGTPFKPFEQLLSM
jgi:5'-3' exoribonuclease 1